MIVESKPDTRLKPGYVRKDDRGTFIEIVNQGPWESAITGIMKPGAVLGNHFHRRTRLLLYLISGAAVVTQVCVQTLVRSCVRLRSSEGIVLEPGIAHAIRFSVESAYILLKSIAYSPVDPDTHAFTVLTVDSNDNENCSARQPDLASA